MPKIVWTLLAVFGLSIVNGQADWELTPEVKAYLFHTVRKSPILERNIGKAFEYSGPLVKLEDGQINYDSIDKILIIEPTYLVIRNETLRRSSKGILTEACNKTALYEMCRQIALYRDGASLKSLPLLSKYFFYLFQELPDEFQRGKNYDFLLNNDVSPILQTNVSFNERLFLAQMEGSFKGVDCKKLFEAQEKAVNQSISERTQQLFLQLGGRSNRFVSILMAAGDGSYTEGLLRERDRDENGEWNKGLPKAIGLFPYEVKLEGEKKNELKTLRITEKSMYTYGKNQNTEVHFDVWGYNSNNQTTVIVEKGNRQYPLFGSESTRFLTPDSTFSKGNTFVKILNDLYQATFLDLKNQLYGKEGLDPQLRAAQQLLGEIETAINQKEGELGDLYKEDYRTNNRMKKEEKQRLKEIQLGQEKDAKPTTKARKKAKNKKQWDLVELYGAYDETLAIVDALTEDYYALANDYNAHLDLYSKYKSVLGTQWLPYTVLDGLYTFSDGTTFDIFTQNLTFPGNDSVELIQVRLLSIPEDFEGNKSDEIMMHVSMVDAEPFYDADFEVKFQDIFSPDDYQFNGTIFSSKDSIFFQRLFGEVKKNHLPISFDLEGHGIGKWQDSIILRDPIQAELTGYPGNNAEEKRISRESDAFKSLRQSRVQLKINRSLQIHVISTTDPVVSNLNTPAFSVESFMKSYQISRNEVLSLLRTRTLVLQLKKELVANAAKYLPASEAKRFIDEIEDAYNTSKYRVSEKSVKLPKIKD
ncbi:MAG: hypothetical protein ACKO7O_03505 [Bacteroidota bacterium]